MTVPSARRVHLMENHDEAYYLWKAAGVQGRDVVHVDAHHDLHGKWATRKNKTIDIGNYIFPALDEGMIKSLWWVVPDGFFATDRARRVVKRQIRKIQRRQGWGRVAIEQEPHRLSTTLRGTPFVTCPVSHLPTLPGNALLDIDVDFFVIPDVSFSGTGAYGEVPWMQPEALLAALEGAGLASDFVTIAYSVEGGYTPLVWKHLGDELALRLKGVDVEDGRLRSMSAVRAAVRAIRDGDLDAALRCYEEAATLDPTFATVPLQRAHLHARRDENDLAAACHAEALAQEPTLRTAYNSAARWYFEQGRTTQAEAAHRRTLVLAPDDSWAQYGLGQVAWKARDRAEAEACFRRAIEARETSVDAWRALGSVLERLRRPDEALRAYERSLNLVLMGHRPLSSSSIVTRSDDKPEDAAHGGVHASAARLHARRGDVREAVDGYRMALLMGVDGVAVRLRLASLLWTHSGRRAGLGEAKRALARVPGSSWRGCVKAWKSAGARVVTLFGASRRRRMEATPSIWH